MKYVIFIVISIGTILHVCADEPETIAATDKPRKNILGADVYLLDGSYYSLFGMNFSARYNRELHRYFDLSTNIGYTLSYFAGNTSDVGGWGVHYLRYAPVVACFTPLKKTSKTFQLGTGHGDVQVP